ncbi:hypothetical protein N9L18_01350 [Candidatus Pacebacteria bacterium]|nr:hypothetical protein [Candidatus Paceibacterota bacterium]
MNTKAGAISIPVIVSIVVAVLVAGGISFFLLYEPEEKTPVEESIQDALSTDDRAKGVNPSRIVIVKHEGQFARGTVFDLNDQKKKTFYAIQIGDHWRIADVVEDSVSCERFTRIGFPADLIPDCQLSFPDAVTVAEIDATIDQEFLEEAPLQIIGLVQNITINEQEGTASIEIASGGVSTTVESSSGNVSGIETGDTVVITAEVIVEPNQNNNDPEQGVGGTTISVSNVTQIGEEDDDIVLAENTNPLPQETGGDEEDNDDGTSQNNPVNSGGGTILKINAPVTAPPVEQFFNAFDIDNSFEDIKIDGSF